MSGSLLVLARCLGSLRSQSTCSMKPSAAVGLSPLLMMRWQARPTRSAGCTPPNLCHLKFLSSLPTSLVSASCAFVQRSDPLCTTPCSVSTSQALTNRRSLLRSILRSSRMIPPRALLELRMRSPRDDRALPTSSPSSTRPLASSMINRSTEKHCGVQIHPAPTNTRWSPGNGLASSQKTYGKTPFAASGTHS